MKKILILFLLLIFANSILAQNLPNDCVNAIVVCGNGTFSSNANGIGNTQEVAGCYSSEHNSLWLKINIVQSGTLGFDLIPNDTALAVDYDFWVYGPNKTCGSLGSPIRCCTTNPIAANLSNNRTGLNDTITATTSGNGANGNGYVYRLSVIAGQSYYIAVDRPHGDGGFQIQWNGTATLNGGAFPSPPTANQIPDVKRCSNTPNVGIFDLNPIRSQINSDLTNNTINFYATLANAVDRISPLPNIMTNSPNPQKIYARVTNNASGCYTIIDFNLMVYPVPNANISISDTVVCSGTNVTVNFTGTPGATIEYTINSGPVQTFLFDGTGTFQLVQTITANTTYALVDAKILDGNNTTVCHQTENDTVSVTVSTVSAPTLTTNSPICEGDTAILNFSGLANALISYSVNAGTPSTVTLDASGQKQVNLTNLPAGSYQINLSNITDSNAPNCSQPLNINETVIVNPKITAALSVSPNVCEGSTSQITFTGTGGTGPYVFVYHINSGTNQTITTIGGNSISINIPNAPGTFTYQLVSVASTLTPGCVFPQTGTATVTVHALPAISGILSLCQGTTTQLVGSGLPATITPWASDNTAVATVSTSGLVTGVSAGTASITYVGANGCGISEIVTIKQLPTITGNFSTCINSTSQLMVSENPAANTWSSSNPSVATVNANGLVSAISQGTSIITYASSNSCIATTLFTVYTAPAITGSTVICSNGTTQLTGSGTPATANPWMSNNTAVATINGNGVVSGVSAGSTLITYSDSNGCANTITLTVNALPVISGVLSACEGLTTQLVGSGIPSGTNPWTSSNTTVATVNASGLVTGIVPGTTTITYTNNNGCKSTAVVTINALPAITGALTVCTGSTTLLTGSGNPASQSPWTSSVTVVATVSATGLVTGVSAGTTTITYSNIYGCSITRTVTVLSTPTATISNLGASTICSGNAVNIQITGVSGTTVNYSVNSNTISAIIPASGVISISSAITSATTFTLLNAANGSCTNTIGQSVTVNVTQPPAATISYNGPYCVTESSPQTITFSGTLGGYYSVSPSTGLSINSTTGAVLPSGSIPGTYQVTYNVAPSGGCPLYTSSSATVIILNGPTATISYGSIPFCVSDAVQVNVIQTGTTGGIYSVIPSGLSIDSSSGTVNPSMSTPGIYTVYYKIVGSGGCPELIEEATVTILGIPRPDVNSGVLCMDAATNLPFTTVTLSSGLNPDGFTFKWYFNGIQVGSSSEYVANQIGSYTLVVTNSANCSATVFTSVTSSYPALADDVTYTVNNYFEDNQITITVEGTGAYLYSLDGGPFQENNTFSDVSSGEHSVTVRDSEGCTDITIDKIITIGYPNYFTPNGDGYHDTWNISSLPYKSNGVIQIFDRYGKLIRQITTKGEGWDGRFNGQELPSTDYWFSIQYNEDQVDKVFKSHFSLKR